MRSSEIRGSPSSAVSPLLQIYIDADEGALADHCKVRPADLTRKQTGHVATWHGSSRSRDHQRGADRGRDEGRGHQPGRQPAPGLRRRDHDGDRDHQHRDAAEEQRDRRPQQHPDRALDLGGELGGDERRAAYARSRRRRRAAGAANRTGRSTEARQRRPISRPSNRPTPAATPIDCHGLSRT